MKMRSMNSILITPKDSKELRLLQDLLDRMKIRTKVLSVGEKEDYGLSILMKGVDRNKKVSRDTIMKKLK